MKKTKNTLLLSSAIVLFGCSNTMQSPELETKTTETISIEQMQPALISASDKNTDLLSAAISKALNGTKVTLSPDAFTQSNKMSTERLMQEKIGQQGMNGRMYETPDNASHSFSLYRNGDDCYLIKDKTGQQYLVNGLVCK